MEYELFNSLDTIIKSINVRVNIHIFFIRDYMSTIAPFDENRHEFRQLISKIQLPESFGLLQESQRNFGSPDSQGLMARRQNSNWSVLIDQIAISVVFNHVSCWVPPVVKNLGSQNMPAHAPDGLIALTGEPLMS